MDGKEKGGVSRTLKTQKKEWVQISTKKKNGCKKTKMFLIFFF